MAISLTPDIRCLRAAQEEFEELCFEYGIELDDVVRAWAPGSLLYTTGGPAAAAGGRPAAWH